MEGINHKAGFIHLLGKPNVGKSTLFNNLVKTQLAITTPKAQTTRQTLIGIDNGPHHQAIYIDTPGHITPAYPLQKAMMRDVARSIPGSDLCAWVVDINDEVKPDFFPSKWQKITFPSFLLINKRDLLEREKSMAKKSAWEAITPPKMQVHLISALCKSDVKTLSQLFTDLLPSHLPYYEKDSLTDRPQTFILSEIVRKSLLLHYAQEIPYSTQVEISQPLQKGDVVHIQATIYVERETQKRILIGRQGQALKRAGTTARKELEEFLGKKVFLQQHVKVAPKWRSDPVMLKRWGYN